MDDVTGRTLKIFNFFSSFASEMGRSIRNVIDLRRFA